MLKRNRIEEEDDEPMTEYMRARIEKLLRSNSDQGERESERIEDNADHDEPGAVPFEPAAQATPHIAEPATGPAPEPSAMEIPEPDQHAERPSAAEQPAQPSADISDLMGKRHEPVDAAPYIQDMPAQPTVETARHEPDPVADTQPPADGQAEPELENSGGQPAACFEKPQISEKPEVSLSDFASREAVQALEDQIRSAVRPVVREWASAEMTHLIERVLKEELAQLMSSRRDKSQIFSQSR